MKAGMTWGSEGRVLVEKDWRKAETEEKKKAVGKRGCASGADQKVNHAFKIQNFIGG
jgi:hypothetical protein